MPRLTRKMIPAAGLLLLAACGEPIGGSGRGGSKPDFVTELMAADRSFAAEVAAAAPAERAAVWAGWFAPDGRQVVPGAVVQGAESIVALMKGAFTAPGYSLEWDPDSATASADGTLGWTTGRYVNRREGPGGRVESEGRYLSLWKRMPDGSWKVDLDTGVPDE